MVAAIIQARLGSTRLPNKVLTKIAGFELIWHIVERLKKCSQIDKIILATTINPKDEKLVEWANKNGIPFFRGDEENVLKRYYDTATNFKSDIIVRITADDPFKDPQVIDQVILKHKNSKSDLTTNNFPPTFPEGLDVEVFNYEALKRAFNSSIEKFEKEHVTQFFYRNADIFKITNYSYKENLSHLRFTVDTEEDFRFATEIYNRLFTTDNFFTLNDILKLLQDHPELIDINKDVKRSTMYLNNLK